MKVLDYQQLILKGIQDLPKESLKQIADFVIFTRKKALNPKEYQDDIAYELLNQDLRALSETEQEHLEDEFRDYQKNHPVE